MTIKSDFWPYFGQFWDFRKKKIGTFNSVPLLVHSILTHFNPPLSFLDIMSQKSMFPMTLSSAQRISSHRILDHIGGGGNCMGRNFMGQNSTAQIPTHQKHGNTPLMKSSYPRAMGISSHTIPPPPMWSKILCEEILWAEDSVIGNIDFWLMMESYLMWRLTPPRRTVYDYKIGFLALFRLVLGFRQNKKKLEHLLGSFRNFFVYKVFVRDEIFF